MSSCRWALQKIKSQKTPSSSSRGLLESSKPQLTRLRLQLLLEELRRLLLPLHLKRTPLAPKEQAPVQGVDADPRPRRRHGKLAQKRRSRLSHPHRVNRHHRLDGSQHLRHSQMPASLRSQLAQYLPDGHEPHRMRLLVHLRLHDHRKLRWKIVNLINPDLECLRLSQAIARSLHRQRLPVVVPFRLGLPRRLLVQRAQHRNRRNCPPRFHPQAHRLDHHLLRPHVPPFLRRQRRLLGLCLCQCHLLRQQLLHRLPEDLLLPRLRRDRALLEGLHLRLRQVALALRSPRLPLLRRGSVLVRLEDPRLPRLLGDLPHRFRRHRLLLERADLPLLPHLAALLEDLPRLQLRPVVPLLHYPRRAVVDETISWHLFERRVASLEVVYEKSKIRRSETEALPLSLAVLTNRLRQLLVPEALPRGAWLGRYRML